MSALTWDEVRARSERNNTYCYDCYVSYHDCGYQLPCRRHGTLEENAERDRKARAVINSAPIGDHPLLRTIEHGIDENEPPMIPQRKREP